METFNAQKAKELTKAFKDNSELSFKKEIDALVAQTLEEIKKCASKGITEYKFENTGAKGLTSGYVMNTQCVVTRKGNEYINQLAKLGFQIDACPNGDWIKLLWND